MPCNNCAAPASVTNVYNNTVAASNFLIENITVAADKTVTLSSLPDSGGFFLLFLESVYQKYGTDYTVDFLTGILTISDADIGQTVSVVYIPA